jgi:hypothetical protein
MQQLPTIQQVRETYKKADKSTKKALENLFGKSALSDVTDRIKLPVDAFRELGIDYNDARATACPSDFNNGLLYFHRLQVICAALNEGWTPDWSNSNQPKYYPWFAFLVSRFVFDDVYYRYASSSLGSRLCFRTRELAEYAGKQFEDLYNRFFTL